MTAAGGGEAPPAVALHGIVKRFPGVLANDGISLAFRAGEVHALLGENGAGKSTLVAILSGMLRPDSGRIEVAGREVRIAAPAAALRLGIGTVHQHALLVESLTAIENLMLGAPWWRRCDRKAALSRFGELAQLLSVAVAPDVPVGRLSPGERQQVEIVRALWHGGRVLILDEPTSMLTPKGVEDLAAVVRRLRGRGVAVVFITHKLQEARELADRISVLRRGRLVGALGPEALRAASGDQAIETVVAMMFERGEQTQGIGQTLLGAATPRPAARPAPAQHSPRHEEAAPLLSMRAARTAGERGECPLAGADLDILAGEILGIAGVDGNGQKHLAEALAGQRPLLSGALSLAGRAIEGLGVGARRRLGIRYVTDERLGEGTAPHHSLAVNLLLKEIGRPPFWRGGVTLWQRIYRHARRTLREAGIAAASERVAIVHLSGGNIQKALLAREWTPDARLLILNKPTHGLDLQSTRRARDWIAAAGAAGATVVVVSNELDELLELCRRIAVMERGRIAGVVENGEGAATAIGRLMTGVAGEAPAGAAGAR